MTRKTVCLDNHRPMRLCSTIAIAVELWAYFLPCKTQHNKMHRCFQRGTNKAISNHFIMPSGILTGWNKVNFILDNQVTIEEVGLLQQVSQLVGSVSCDCGQIPESGCGRSFVMTACIKKTALYCFTQFAPMSLKTRMLASARWLLLYTDVGFYSCKNSFI